MKLSYPSEFMTCDQSMHLKRKPETDPDEEKKKNSITRKRMKLF